MEWTCTRGTACRNDLSFIAKDRDELERQVRDYAMRRAQRGGKPMPVLHFEHMTDQLDVYLVTPTRRRIYLTLMP